MKLYNNQITIFEKLGKEWSSNSIWFQVFALHYDWSITWRFLFHYKLLNLNFRIAYFFRKNGFIDIAIPIIGRFYFAWQENMKRTPEETFND